VKKYSLVAFLILFSLFSRSQSFTGSWKGVLSAGSQKLRIIFHLKSESGNLYSSTFDSPDQHAFGIPCSETNIKGDSVEMLIKQINGGYRGKWDGKDLISGYYFQNGLHFNMDLSRTSDSVVVQIRPQTPKPPFPYHVEDLEYDNPANGIHYAGTLTYPDSGGPFPAAILITGSGPEDRDETIFGHKPFAVIADYLTRRGYAVLRVDDRQTGKSTGDLSKATTLDFSKDVETSFQELRKRKDIDQKRMGLIGHSEGGLIASILASENNGIDFIILLAGPGLKGYELMALQNQAYEISMGVDQKIAEADTKLKKNLMQAALSSPDTAVQYENAWKSYEAWKSATDPGLVSTMGLNEEPRVRDGIRTSLKAYDNPWMNYFLKSDPSVYLTKVHCKVLALNGSKDIQVVADPNLAAIEDALKKSSSKIHSTQKLEGLNHLFQHCKTCTVQEYGELEETFAPEALQIMADWLDKNVK
jgi:uncharacterized protein